MTADDRTPEFTIKRLAQIGTALADLEEVQNGVSGVKGRYGWKNSGASQHINMYVDLRWLLDHAEHINNALAAASARAQELQAQLDAQPDVDGWSVRIVGGEVALSRSHYTDSGDLTGWDLPVGAVLAFIADHEGDGGPSNGS